VQLFLLKITECHDLIILLWFDIPSTMR